MNAPAAPLDWQSLTETSLHALAARARKAFAPPPKLGITAWANRYRYLSSEAADPVS